MTTSLLQNLTPSCSECLWCADTSFMRSHLDQYLKSFGTEPVAIKSDIWIEQAISSLSRCMDCVEVYHQLIKEAFNIDPRFKTKRSNLLELVNNSNTTRLRECFFNALEDIKAERMTGSDEEEQQYSQLQYRSHTLDCPIRELLKFPTLLMSEELNEQLAAAIQQLYEIDQLPQINDKYPGLYLLLVHPNPQVCSWAVRTVKSLGSLDWDDYDEMEEVINWMMDVISFNLFLNDDDCAEIAEQRINKTILPKHLFIQRSPKEFWIGICMLIKAMDGGCIRSRLMSVNGHRELVDTVLLNLTSNADKNYTPRVDKARCIHTPPTVLSARTTIFWPAMQCYSVLLDKLGSRFWQHTFKDPSVVIRDIFSNPYYCFELTQWATLNCGEDTEDSTSHESDNELVSNSQIVQDWKPALRPREVIQLTQTVIDELDYETEEDNLDTATAHRKSRMSVFSWISPFINSILDFGEGSYPNIHRLVQVAHAIFMGAMLGKNSFEFIRDGQWCIVSNTTTSSIAAARAYDILSYSAFANEAFLTLVNIVDLLVTKGFFAPLVSSQNSWLEDIALGAKALIHSACSGDGKVAHPTSLQQLARVMVEFMTTKYARDDTELSELLLFIRRCALTKQCSPAMLGLKTTLAKFITGNVLRNKLVDIIKHCETSVLDDFVTSKGTVKSSSYINKAVVSDREKSPPVFEEQEAPVVPKSEPISTYCDDIDRDLTPDLLSEDELSSEHVAINNIQKEDHLPKSDNSKSSPKDYAAESSTDDCESPHLRGCNRGSLNSAVPGSHKDCTLQVRPSGSKAALSRKNNISTKKVLVQTTLPLQGLHLTASSKANVIDGGQQLNSSKTISSNYPTTSTTQEAQSKQMCITEKSIVTTGCNIEGVVKPTSKPSSPPICARLQHKSVSNSSNDVIMILSDSEEASKELDNALSWPESGLNVGRHSDHNQIQSSSLSHEVVKSFSLDSKDSMYEGLSELKKMVDPHHCSRRSVIDLRDEDESSPGPSTSDSDDDGIPLMERFASMASERPGNARKKAVTESESDDNAVQVYRSSRKPDFLSMSEEDSGSGSEDSESQFPPVPNVLQRSYSAPADGRPILSKSIQMRNCKVMLRKCCSAQDATRFTSDVDIDTEKSVRNVSDSNHKAFSTQKVKRSLSCGSINADAFLPNVACVSDMPEKMSPTPMDISDSDLPVSPESTDLRKPVITHIHEKALEHNELQVQFLEKGNQHLLPPRRQTDNATNQCRPNSSCSVLQAKPTVHSISESKTTDLPPSLMPLARRQMPVATVAPMGFPASTSGQPAKNTDSSHELTKKKQLLLPPRKLPSNRRKVPTFENCQAQFKNPNDYSCTVERSPADLLSTIMPGNSTQTLKETMPTLTTKPLSAAASASVNRVIIKPKVPFRMNDFHIKVLSWDPQWFLYPQESEDRQLLCPSPAAWFPDNLRVPLVFPSIDQYCQIFSPLLLVEVWEEIYNGTQGKSSPIPPPCVLKVEAVSAADHPLLQIIKCKMKLPLELGKQYAHPVQQHLVRVELQQQHSADTEGLNLFAYVDSYTRILQHPPPSHDPHIPSSSGPNPGPYFELTLCLRISKLDFAISSSLENHEVRCTVVTTLADYVRKWNGLVNLHTSPLAANILSPLGGVYFGGGKQQPSEGLRNEVLQMLGNQYNDSQKNAVLAAVQATQAGFVHPRICLLQGPPGTGKTHTIVGLIRALFRVLRTQQPSGSSLPGQKFGGLPPTAPHILLCAPSNTAVDEVVKRLIRKGHVRHTNEWKERYRDQLPPNAPEKAGLPGFTVVRVGQDDKIDPLVKPISLDELAKKGLIEEKSLVPQLDQLRKEISVLEKEVESLENELCLAKKKNTGKVKSLEQALNQQQERKNNLIMQHRDARAKQRNSHREQSMLRKRLLMSADIICSTLCGSGSSVMECFLGNPLHFSCVVVDEASQCCELDLLIPLRYKSSKLILIGDPLQLSATVKSQKAQEHGLGQSLFERLYNHFSQMSDEDNPVKMLQIQYRMLPQICQFPSQHFYKGKLESPKDMDTAFPFKPFLLFDVTIGQEKSNDGGSIINMTEATLVINICKVLLKSINCSQIGIITPYKAQERLIRTELKEKLGVQNIDVGTVDGYQGKEKDVTILSCVRARNTSGSIGFLWSRQRMNVSLTRAKKALYILCHVESLKVCPDWDALIQNAADREILIPVNNNDPAVAQGILKPQADQRSSAAKDDSSNRASARLGQACASTELVPTTRDSTHGGRAEPAVRDPRNPNKCRSEPYQSAGPPSLDHRRTHAVTSRAAPKGSAVRHHDADVSRQHGRESGQGYREGTKRAMDRESSGEAKRMKVARDESYSPQAICNDESTVERRESAAGTSFQTQHYGARSSDTPSSRSSDVNSAWRPYGGERPRQAHPKAAVMAPRQPPIIESPIIPKRKLSAREEIERLANRKRKPS